MTDLELLGFLNGPLSTHLIRLRMVTAEAALEATGTKIPLMLVELMSDLTSTMTDAARAACGQGPVPGILPPARPTPESWEQEERRGED